MLTFSFELTLPHSGVTRTARTTYRDIIPVEGLGWRLPVDERSYCWKRITHICWTPLLAEDPSTLCTCFWRRVAPWCTCALTGFPPSFFPVMKSSPRSRNYYRVSFRGGACDADTRRVRCLFHSFILAHSSQQQKSADHGICPSCSCYLLFLIPFILLNEIPTHSDHAKMNQIKTFTCINDLIINLVSSLLS